MNKIPTKFAQIIAGAEKIAIELNTSPLVICSLSDLRSAVSELVEECMPIECDAPDVINADTADPMDAMNFGFNQI